MSKRKIDESGRVLNRSVQTAEGIVPLNTEKVNMEEITQLVTCSHLPRLVYSEVWPVTQ